MVRPEFMAVMKEMSMALSKLHNRVNPNDLSPEELNAYKNIAGAMIAHGSLFLAFVGKFQEGDVLACGSMLKSMQDTVNPGNSLDAPPMWVQFHTTDPTVQTIKNILSDILDSGSKATILRASDLMDADEHDCDNCHKQGDCEIEGAMRAVQAVNRDENPSREDILGMVKTIKDRSPNILSDEDMEKVMDHIDPNKTTEH